ncbi:MAG: hypothetical protein ACKO65_07615 [Betaproteobacteria bacterium]
MEIKHFGHVQAGFPQSCPQHPWKTARANDTGWVMHIKLPTPSSLALPTESEADTVARCLS